MDYNLFAKSKDGKFLFEGPLSDDNINIKILFVMEEPHGEELNCFWMKEKVLTQKEGSRYYNVLGAFAKKILNEKNNGSALKQCAYINFYPFKGDSTAKLDKETRKSYKDLIKDWEKTQKNKGVFDLEAAHSITFESSNQELLCNRLRIIKDALDHGIDVVAFHEIVKKLTSDKMFEGMFKKSDDYADNKCHIACYQYKDTAKLHAIPHPATRGNSNFNYENLAKILNISSVYSK